MKETREILKTLEELPENANAVLATVVDVDGSSFRLPGAKMLILEDGMTVGTVSGGCLEADVLARANEVRETGDTSLFVYDTTGQEDSVFSLNMGCRGIVRILMEPAMGNKSLEFLRDNLENSRSGVIATLITGEQKGSHVIVDSEGVRHSTFADPEVTQKVLARADGVMNEKRSKMIDTGAGEIFFEFVPLPTKLFIFGAGADAVPLTRIGSELGWKTHVIDHRPAYAAKPRFPLADAVSLQKQEELGTKIEITDESLAVVMTHNYQNDKQIIARLLDTDVRYIGAMGPKSRTEQILSEIKASGIEVKDEMRARIHGPVGLDIGATTPEGIALAIVAEIQTVLSGRGGGFLREREGSIYGRD